MQSYHKKKSRQEQGKNKTKVKRFNTGLDHHKTQDKARTAYDKGKTEDRAITCQDMRIVLKTK